MAMLDQFLGSPVTQFGMGMLAGNQGPTGGEAFSNALRSGMMGFNRSAALASEMARQKEAAELVRARREQLEREEEQRRRLVAAAPQIAAGLSHPDPKTRQEAIEALMGFQPQLLGPYLASQAKPTGTSLMRNVAAAYGAMPGTPEFQQAMQEALSKPQTQVNIGDSGPKLQPGYMWRDPNNPAAGMKPIPGGSVEKEQRKEEYRLGATQNALDRYRKVLSETGPTWVMGASKAKLQTAYNDMMIEMKELFNLGVLQGPDMMIMERTLTDPTTINAQVLQQMGGMPAFMAQLDLVQQKLDNAKTRAAWLSSGAPATQMPNMPTGWRIEEVP